MERETCGHCGHLIEECADPERLWYPQRVICYATRERAAAAALYAKLHEDKPYHDGDELIWSEKRSRLTPYHYDDGVTIIVTDWDMNPDDEFLGKSAADGIFSG